MEQKDTEEDANKELEPNGLRARLRRVERRSPNLLTNALLGALTAINSAVFMLLVTHVLDGEIHDDASDKKHMIQNEIGQALSKKVPPPEVTQGLASLGKRVDRLEERWSEVSNTLTRIEETLKNMRSGR